ncbi:MAG TPA: hypothetical protein VNU49_06790 [Opitutaceae bacterium]|jgi:hypothetical protein|nr:hypothetical protein [Opitutaceae bacterium]
MKPISPETLKYFQERVAEANKGITHADFVAGVRAGTLTFIFPSTRPYQMIVGANRKKKFACWVIFYLVAPLAVVPLWAWQQGNNWLLFGILASYIGSVATAKTRSRRRQYQIGGWIGSACLLAWIFLGRHNYYTVFLTCAEFGSLFFMIADEVEEQLARDSLIENAEHFNAALENQLILIHRNR